MPERRVAAVVVVLLDPGRDPGPGLGLGGEVLEAAQLELQGGVPALDDGVVQRRARPGPSTGSRRPGSQAARNGPGGVLAALVGVQDAPRRSRPAPPRTATAIAAPRGQRGVVMLAEGEPDDPSRAHVQHAVQEQLALVGDDLGAVAVPLAVEPARRRSRARSGPGPATGPCPGRVVCLRRRFAPGRPAPARA